MSETFEYLRMFAQFPFAARRFLREPLSYERATEIVRERMRTRTENFLRVVEQNVFNHSSSPYLALLKRAGCESDDLATLARQKGIEGALAAIRKEGVYVTFEEFKGRKPIVRGQLSLQVKPADFDNPNARRDFGLTTGGSTGMANAVYHDFDYIAAGAPHHVLMLKAWQVLDVPMLNYLPILPGGGIRFLMQRAFIRQNADIWYSNVGWRDSKYWMKYGLATAYMVIWLKLLGGKIPFPKILPPDQALVIARWIFNTLQRHGRCLLYMIVSHAVRICAAASEAGLDLTGAVFRTGGEPHTFAKVNQITKTGARDLPAYGAIDTGSLALGCADSEHVGDVHQLHDAFALITYPHFVETAGVTVPAFNLTGLLDSAPKVMLNYQIDDYGIVEERSCNCALGKIGFQTHLREIRSYSKSVGEGVSLVGNELQQILEQTLPAQFGGTPLDYQWLEQEDESGFTRLYLVISPRVTISDQSQVLGVVYHALKDASPMADSARTIWQQTQTIQILRREPISTARGKLMPLHIQRRTRGS
jgi:hypothetical protein